MGDITINSAVRANLQTLQSTAQLMAQTQNRLATGLKVSSALDNPQSYFTAAGLNARATDLGALQDSMSLGVQTLKAADEGIKSIQKLVNQARSVANQALQAKTTDTTLSATATAADLSAATGSALEFTIQVGDNSAVTITLDAANYATAASAAAAVKAKIDAANIEGLTVTNTSGNLSFKLASGEDLTIEGLAAASLGIDGDSDNGETIAEARSSYVTDYNNLREQISQLATDASFNGINLLNGDSLLVKFNEDGTSNLNIEGVTFDAAGLNIAETTFADIDADIALLDSATATLRKQASTFGANLSVVQNRQDFTKNMINVLEGGAGALTLADTNVEAANLLALQTRQSLAQTSLSLANQAEQAVLSLIR
jgi:flagellin-like hook-associated protein FlgL